MSLFKRLRSKVSSQDPLIIQPYYGYASPSSLFVKGRILENEGIFEGQSESAIRTLLDNFKRFETDEVPGASVRIDIVGKSYDLVTDREGYFTLDTDWDYENSNADNWLQAKVTCNGIDGANADVFYAPPSAKYGIITDIDDTVLQTNVTSLFKLKMLYATFFKDAHQRLPMEGIVDLFSKFAENDSPVFYISHSPWNIFDTLSQFMEIQGLPKGPILLRDYGINPIGNFTDHKMVSIKRILDNHPNLQFVMLGDTAAEDAEIYLTLAEQYAGQISAIYIRQTKNTKNARKVKSLIEQHSNKNTEVILSESSVEMIAHARSRGFIS